MSKSSDRIEAAAHLAAVLTEEARAAEAKTPAETPWPAHWAARDAIALIKIARAMDNLAVRQCNEPWGDKEYERAERRRAKALERIKEIGKPYGFKGASVHGDPRGFVVRIDLASGRKNGWGDGWGVGA